MLIQQSFYIELVDERKNQKVQMKLTNECVGTTYKPHTWLIFAWFHKCIAHQAHNFLSVISKKNFNVKAKISSKQVWKRYLIRYSAYNPWTGILSSIYVSKKRILSCTSKHTANILLVKKATFPCLLFPVYFKCIFSTQEVL